MTPEQFSSFEKQHVKDGHLITVDNALALEFTKSFEGEALEHSTVYLRELCKQGSKFRLSANPRIAIAGDHERCVI